MDNDAFVSLSITYSLSDVIAHAPIYMPRAIAEKMDNTICDKLVARAMEDNEGVAGQGHALRPRLSSLVTATILISLAMRL